MPVIKIEMPDSFLDKVKFLCKSIPKDEWSGILFYRPVGSIKDVENFKIILEDILPLDKGSATYTEYDNLEEMLNYFEEPGNEALDLGYQDGSISIGHIHSHNTMAVFFSGTDTTEIKDNSQNHFYYLSLIVNNFMDFKAKIATRGTYEYAFEKEIDVISKDELGNAYVIDKKTIRVNSKEDIVYIYDCEIISNQPILNISASWADRVKALIEKAATKAKQYTSEWQNRMKNTGKGHNKLIKASDKFPKRNFGSEDINWKFEDDEITFPVGEFISEHAEDTEDFTILLLRHGNIIPKDSIENVLEDIKIANEDPQEFAASIVQIYNPIYDKFHKGEEDSSNLEFFLDFLEDVINLLEDYEARFKFLTLIVMGLKNFGHKIEETLKDESYGAKI